MKKEIYNLLKRANFMTSKIAKIAKEDRCGYTIKFLQEELKKMQTLQESRAKNKIVREPKYKNVELSHTKWQALRDKITVNSEIPFLQASRVSRRILLYAFKPVRIGNVFVELGTDLAISYFSYATDYYRNRPILTYDIKLTLPADSWQKGLHCQDIDGIATILPKKMPEKNVFVTPCWILKSCNNSNCRPIRSYLAKINGYFAHGTTPKNALAACKKKAKINEREKTQALQPITKDTIITRSLYHRLTGACAEGMKVWLADRGLSKKRGIKISELLEHLQPEDWGYDKITKLIAQNG